MNKVVIAQSQSPEIKFTNVSVSEGLPNNFIHDIIQDSFGFIWVGTTDGLCRYDSKDDFKTYVENGELDLKSSSIRSLLADSKNKIWIGTRLGGLTCYNQKNRSTKTYLFDAEDPNSISNNEILSIFEDSKGRIWVGTEYGLNLYLPDTDSFHSWTPNENDPTALQKNAILTITEDSRGFIWVGCWAGGLNLVLNSDSEDPAKMSFRHFSMDKTIVSENAWSIIEDHLNRLWIGTHGGGIYILEFPQNATNNTESQNWDLKKIHFDITNTPSLNSNTVDDLFQDKNLDVWLATTAGLHLISGDQIDKTLTENSNLKLISYINDASDKTSIAGSVLNKIFKDKNNTFWAGSINGLSKFTMNPKRIEYLPIHIKQYLNHLNKNFYVEKDSIVWICGSTSGLFKQNLISGEISKVPLQNIEQNTKFLTITKEGSKFVIGTNKAIIELDQYTLKTKTYKANDLLLKSTNFLFSRFLFIDNAGIIYISTEFGLVTLDRETGIFELHLSDKDDPHSLSDNAINEIYQTSDGTIWVTTYKGLNKLIAKEDGKLKFKSFLNKNSPKQSSLGSNQIICLEEIKGILYIGTTYGLNKLDLKTDEISRLSQDTNKSYVLSLESDSENNLWYSTSDGITRYNIEQKSYRNFDAEDGVIDNNFRLITSCASKNFLYFGNQNGISRVNIADSQLGKAPPITHITEANLINKDGEKELNLIGQDEITLPANNYYLALKFIGLDYDRMEKIQYAYKLEGFDEEWFYPKKNIPAVYTNLAPGNYVFKTKTANNEGLWSEKIATLKIKKEPSFIEKPWVKLLIILLTIALILSAISAYTSRIKANNLRLQSYNDNLNKEISERKKAEEYLTKINMDLQQFAYGASHDLQEPLRNVGNAVGLLQRKNDFDEKSNEYVEIAVDGVKRMSALIENLLNYAKSGSQSTVREIANLNQIVSEKVTDLSQLIASKNAEVIIEELPNILCEENQIGVVFYNLINNGLKFNQNNMPKVVVSSMELDDCWQFSVSDNGIGISKKYQNKVFAIFSRLENKREYEGTGIGLSLCQKIVSRHNGKIWIESKENEGSTFHFTIQKNLKAVSS